MKRTQRAVGVILWVDLLFTTSALAQTGADTVKVNDTAAQNGGQDLNEIVVTATRQAEPISRVPISVSAISEERIDQLGIKNFDDVARFTPGVHAALDDNGNSGGNISIRGIASTAGAATTGVYIDDTPIQIRSFGQGANQGQPIIFDLDRIEILRGPQGTLFGAGSEGGTVRYITPQPSLDKFGVYARSEISATQGGQPSYEAGGAVGGPIIQDKVGFRMSVYERDSGGWIDHIDYHDGHTIDKDSNRSNNFAARAAFAFQPFDGLLITPSVDYQSKYINDTSQYWEYYSNNHHFENGNPNPLPGQDSFTLPGLRVQYDFGKVSLISNTSYFKRDEQGRYDTTIEYTGYLDSVLGSGSVLAPSGPRYDVYGIEDFRGLGLTENSQRNLTQEVRLQSKDPDSVLSWVVGGYFQRNTQTNVVSENIPQLPEFIENTLGGVGLTNFLGVPDLLNCPDGGPFRTEPTVCGPGLLYYALTTEREKQFAGFANVTLTLMDKLKLSAGVRYSNIKFSYDSSTTLPGVAQTGSGSTTDKPVTPKAIVSYQITPADMVYASAAKGFRVGGINGPIIPFCIDVLAQMGISSPKLPFGPDSVWSYEIGAKGRTEGGLFQYAASAYHINWSNIQQTNSIPACGYQYIANLGQARVDGFDFQGSSKLTNFFTLDYAVGYTHARYTKTTLYAPTPDSPIAVEKGDALNGVVPWTAVIGGLANFEVANRRAYARFDDEWSSHGATGALQDPLTGNFDPNIPVTPATNYVRARLGMLFDGLDVSLFVDNLFDASPELTRTHQNLTTQLYTGTTFRPRTAGITFIYRH